MQIPPEPRPVLQAQSPSQEQRLADAPVLRPRSARPAGSRRSRGVRGGGRCAGIGAVMAGGGGAGRWCGAKLREAGRKKQKRRAQAPRGREREVTSLGLVCFPPIVPWPALCVCVRTCVLLCCSSCLWYIWNSNHILGSHACFFISLCLLFASVGQAPTRIIASLLWTLFTSLLTHRLVLLCIDAHCFIFWDLPGDVLAAPEPALWLDRCSTSLSLSLAPWHQP